MRKFFIAFVIKYAFLIPVSTLMVFRAYKFSEKKKKTTNGCLKKT